MRLEIKSFQKLLGSRCLIEQEAESSNFHENEREIGVCVGKVFKIGQDCKNVKPGFIVAYQNYYKSTFQFKEEQYDAIDESSVIMITHGE